MVYRREDAGLLHQLTGVVGLDWHLSGCRPATPESPIDDPSDTFPDLLLDLLAAEASYVSGTQQRRPRPTLGRPGRPATAMRAGGLAEARGQLVGPRAGCVTAAHGARPSRCACKRVSSEECTGCRRASYNLIQQNLPTSGSMSCHVLLS